jgi:hypothetical protein
MASLRDPDVSIRRRALDLLFTMADTGSANDIVTELVKYLTVAGGRLEGQACRACLVPHLPTCLPARLPAPDR